MSLFDSASLCITPNAYKEDKLYSIKPTDGSGDLVVTRTTTATRVNSAGLIEIVPRNLLINSNDFITNWENDGTTTRTANNAISPDGTQNATKVVGTGGYGYRFAPTLSVGTYNYSIYFRASVASTITIGINDGGGSGASSQSIAVTTTWQRFNISKSVTLGTAVSISYSGLQAGVDYFLFGAQLEASSTAKEYFPTTDRLNVPRIDYTNGTCPSILVEPQRTNLLTYSNTFTDASWNLEDATISSNVAISPDGTQNASKLVSNANNTDHTIYKEVATSVQRTFSCYVKADGYNYVFLGNNNGLASQGVFFNLTNGTISQNTSTFTASIQSAGNGWYRCTISQALWTIPYAMICLSNNGTSFTFAGNGTSGVLIYGAQNEAGSYATSYIPTVASSVTRNADVISKTGISSLIGQTEGTIYAEVKVSKLIGTASRYIFHISDGTANNRIYMAFSGSSSNVLRGRIFNGGTLQCSIDTSTLTNTGTYKLALAYKNNDIVFYVNGVQIGTDTSATIPTCSRVDLGQNYAGASQLADGINNANIWKTRLTNTELATLTTI
jgi:hypothetical protein